MKKIILVAVFIITLVTIFCLGQKGTVNSSDYAIKINDFVMTTQEFEDYFKKTNVSGQDSSEARKDALDMLISKKLILQEAEKIGLHQGKEFLEALEMYYEQLLFKLIIEKKSEELGPKVEVSEREIRRLYDRMLEKGLVEKPLDEIYDQVEWQAFREKQTKVMSDWIGELRIKAKVEINQSVLDRE